jgi:hypothetical protein
MDQMLVERLAQMLSGKKKWSFTLEHGRDETYNTNGKPVLYGHSTYERSSVLAGRPLRVYVRQWGSFEEARNELAEIQKVVKRFKYDDMGGGGTTHIPISQIVSHLPDDTDY